MHGVKTDPSEVLFKLKAMIWIKDHWLCEAWTESEQRGGGGGGAEDPAVYTHSPRVLLFLIIASNPFTVGSTVDHIITDKIRSVAVRFLTEKQRVNDLFNGVFTNVRPVLLLSVIPPGYHGGTVLY